MPARMPSGALKIAVYMTAGLAAAGVFASAASAQSSTASGQRASASAGDGGALLPAGASAGSERALAERARARGQAQAQAEPPARRGYTISERDGRVIDITITDEDIRVTVNGERLPDERVQRLPGGHARVLEADGSVMFDSLVFERRVIEQQAAAARRPEAGSSRGAAERGGVAQRRALGAAVAPRLWPDDAPTLELRLVGERLLLTDDAGEASSAPAGARVTLRDGSVALAVLRLTRQTSAERLAEIVRASVLPSVRSTRSMGLAASETPGYLLAHLTLPEGAAGAMVTELDENGPAADVGLRVHDVIVSVNGRSVRGPEDLSEALASGTGALELAVRRSGETLSFTVQTRAGTPRSLGTLDVLPTGQVAPAWGRGGVGGGAGGVTARGIARSTPAAERSTREVLESLRREFAESIESLRTSMQAEIEQLRTEIQRLRLERDDLRRRLLEVAPPEHDADNDAPSDRPPSGARHRSSSAQPAFARQLDALTAPRHVAAVEPVAGSRTPCGSELSATPARFGW